MKTARTNDGSWHHAHETTAGAQGSAQSEVVDTWNVATFEESLDRCEDRAYRLAMLLVRDEPTAQEVLQETFLSAWQNVQSFVTRSQFSTWVYRATAKAALGRLDFVKDQERSTAGMCLLSAMTIRRFWGRVRADEASDWFARPSEQLSSEELYRHIRKTVDSLPSVLRTVFVLCDLEEMSLENSAEILDLPVGVAKENLQAARLVIRSAIGHHFSRNAAREARAATQA